MAKSPYDMTDEELEQAFLAAKEELSSGVSSFQDDTSGSDSIVDESTTNNETEEEFDTDDEDVDTTEQPDDVDSDDNSNDENAEDDTNDGSDELDGDDTEKPDEDSKSTNDAVQEVQKYKVKANGLDFDFTLDELQQLAPKALDYTKKMQEIAPWRKTISALKENNVSNEDVNLLIDVLKGDKNAIASILKRSNVDALELDVENNSYQPNSYGRDETELAIQDVVEKYSHDADFGITADIVANKWDAASREVFFKNPDLIEKLHADVKNGDYMPVYAEAQKLKALDGGKKSDLDYFIQAGKIYHEGKQLAMFNQQRMLADQAKKDADLAKAKSEEDARIAKAKEDAAKRAANEKAAKARKAAAPTQKKPAKNVVDYLNESDEQYEEWYAALQSKY